MAPNTSTTTLSPLAQELGKTNPFTNPRQEAYLNLVRTTDVLTEPIAALFREHALTQPQYNALRIVAAAPAPGATHARIGSHLIARSPDVTKLVDRLEKAGLVQRNRCTEDRRVVYVSITPEGRKAVRRIAPKLDALYSALLGHLSNRQVASLNTLVAGARAPHLRTD